MATKQNPVVAAVENDLAKAVKVFVWAGVSAVVSYVGTLVAGIHDPVVALYVTPVVNAVAVYLKQKVN